MQTSRKLRYHFLTLIVPSYKKARTIVGNIRKLKRALEKIRYDYEIVVVVDGMVDKTFQKLKKARIRKLRIIGYDLNQGKSYAIRLGMQYARGDYVMFMDSGAEIDPNGISMLIEHMEWYNADIIVGSKRHPVSRVRYSPMRKILSYGYYIFVKTLFGVRVRDTQAGIKIFKKRVIEKILPRLVVKKFAGDLEILVVAHTLGFKRIYEAPIKLNYNLGGVSSAAAFQSILAIFIDTLAIWYRKNVIQHYDKNRSRIKVPKKYLFFYEFKK